jgi:serine/threonine-protein kinase
MTPEGWQNVKDLFHSALELAPVQRAAFLDRACVGNEMLRREVESLLHSHEESESFLETPALENTEAAKMVVGAGSKLQPGQRIGHYEIVKLAGEGGMGAIYLAHDTTLDRRVALKVLSATFTQARELLRRFVQEAKASAALNHPNIAHIYEIGADGPVNFIAMEFIEGVTLSVKIHSERTELGKLLKYLQQIAEGLAKAHAAGIVHRDLKPDNIMITRDDYSKILDFGLAKLVEPHRLLSSTTDASSAPSEAVTAQASLAGMVMGTAGYMSPEQAQGKVAEIDHRSDIFSFGCILFEAVTRHRPFADESIIRSLHKTTYEAAPLIKEFNPSAPSNLQRIVGRCLAKNREDRYQTIKDVAIELKELCRELESIPGVETAVPRSRNDDPSNQPGAMATKKGDAASTISASVPAPASGSEHRGSGTWIKRHRRNALLVPAVLVAVTATIAFFAYSRYADRSGAGTIRSIAVLPFVNVSGNPDTEYLSDGITDSLINNLSQLPSLKVMSRNSVFHYKGKNADARAVGRELGVQAVLTGRLLQRGDGLAINLELVNASDNSNIWGAQYNRSLSELAGVLGDISEDVTENLRLKLSGEDKQRLAKRQTNNPEAHLAYLKGVRYSETFAPSAFEKAVKYFNQAIAIDPKYAQAYAGLAQAYAELPFGDVPPQEALFKARPAAKRALELDETLAEAHRAMATINVYYDWDWPAAERECRRAIELNPGDALNHQHYGWFLGLMGHFDEGLTELKRAETLDPLSINVNIAIGTNYYWSGQHDRAVEQYQKVMEWDPNVGGLTRIYLGEAYLKQHKFPEAIAEIQKAGQFGVMQTATLGYAYAVSGNRTEAEKVLNELRALSAQKYVPPFTIAVIYAGLGDKDQAFAWLQKANEERSVWMPWLRVDPKFDNLRSDPRFADLVRSLTTVP